MSADEKKKNNGGYGDGERVKKDAGTETEKTTKKG